MTSLRGAWSGCTRAAIGAVQQVRTHGHCDVVAVHDQDAQAVATCRAATGIGSGTTSFDELLATGVDFVVLGGPLHARLAQVEAAAAQSVHCLCTVPFASDVATAAELLARVGQQGWVERVGWPASLGGLFQPPSRRA